MRPRLIVSWLQFQHTWSAPYQVTRGHEAHNAGGNPARQQNCRRGRVSQRKSRGIISSGDKEGLCFHSGPTVDVQMTRSKYGGGQRLPGHRFCPPRAPKVEARYQEPPVVQWMRTLQPPRCFAPSLPRPSDDPGATNDEFPGLLTFLGTLFREKVDPRVVIQQTGQSSNTGWSIFSLTYSQSATR